MRAKVITIVLCFTALVLLGGIVTVARIKLSAATVERVEVRQIATPQRESVNVRREVVKQESAAGAGAVPNFHWTEVESADYKEYISRLRAVQCPEETIRDIIVADINKLYAPREAPFKLVVEAPEDSSGDWHADRLSFRLRV